MSDTPIPNILLPSTSFKTEYPWVEAFVAEQKEIDWLAKDYDMSHDMHSFRTVLTKPERLFVIETLKAFAHYEAMLGVDFWSGRFSRMFPKKEFQIAATVFASMETSVHLPFYTQMMDALGFNTEAFFNSPFEDKDLSKRFEFIKEAVISKNNLHCLASFCYLEGTALFSNMAALMAFKSPGSINTMSNLVAGITHSAADECLHSSFTAQCFKTLKEESSLSPEEEKELDAFMANLEQKVIDHEDAIIERLCSFGEQRSFNKEHLKSFVRSRAADCTSQMGYKSTMQVEDNPIAKWFYEEVESYNVHDFFASQGTKYTRFVNKEQFQWRIR